MASIVNKGLHLGLLPRNQGFKGLLNFPPLFTTSRRISIPPQQQSQLETVSSSQTDAALGIAKQLFLKEAYQKKNVVFSPLSLHVALSMAAAGSSGPTLDRLLTFLRAESTDDLNSFASQLASVVLSDAAPAGGPRLCFSSGVWLEQSLPLVPSYKQLLATYYNATIAPLDFKNRVHEVIDEVNLWAEEKTMGLIKDLLSPGTSVSSFTRLIIANALYFKGAWEDEFDASRTRDHDFHLLNGTSVKVPLMTSKEDQFIGVYNSFKVVRLPYKKGKDNPTFSMYIFLPDANDGLSNLIEQVASEYEFINRHLPFQRVKVGDFKIPKFNISFGLDISNMVIEMGLALPFSEYNANFTNIATPLDEPPLSISNIIQKSSIEVNEEGTKAAAVTGILMRCGCPRPRTYPKVIDFVADHPFLFLIREDLSKTILFTGQVVNPLHGRNYITT